MKSRIITGVFCILTIIFLFASLGHAQSVGTSVQPAYGPSYSVPDHPQHAEQHDLRPEVSLIGGSSYTYAQGERPMSDFPEYRYVKPLGDVARAYRAEHAAAEKATIVWNQQGQ
jgi:hypothetical protein